MVVSVLRAVAVAAAAPWGAGIASQGCTMTLRLYTLGRFSLVRHDKPLRFAARAQSKPLALLKALIAYGGRDVGITTLAASLWPDAEGDLAEQSFKTTLHRLRQLVGNEALVLRDDKLSLDPVVCWVDVDVWVFERLLNQLLPPAAPPDPATLDLLANQSFDLYRGPFLGTEEAPVGPARARAPARQAAACHLARREALLRAQTVRAGADRVLPRHRCRAAA
jgi:hypothetical protein